jgi:hypothetical protein
MIVNMGILILAEELGFSRWNVLHGVKTNYQSNELPHGIV